MRSIAATGLSDNLPDGILPEERGPSLPHEDAGSVLVNFRETLRGSESFLDKNHRAQIDRNHANARSQHPAGSKYLNPAYKGRSKLFKPETKAGMQRAEAAASAAFFSTQDATSVTAEDQDDAELAAGAATKHKALEYHLRESIRWFQTLIGGLQNSWVEGICISTQYWDWRMDVDGDITHDQPAIRLIPLGKFRFSSHADWRDVVGTSSFLIEEMNPTVGELLDDMEKGPGGEAPKWRPCSASTIMAATGHLERHKTGRDGIDGPEEEALDRHKEARVYRVIERMGGVDWVYYVLGTMHLLTEPTKLKDIMPGGMRNYAVGGVTIESHRAIPQSKVEIGEALQAQINSIANDRIDAVKLANTPRYLARRGSGLDMASMIRAVPGGITLTNEMDAVEPITTRDVTGSAYKEEESVKAALDGVLGSFSQQSANTNSNIGRTATGLELIASDSNIMTEYAMKTFAVTWIQDVLRQVLTLIEMYETNLDIINSAMREADTAGQFGIDPGMASERMLRAPSRLRISVGVDATNPERKVIKMRNFVQTAAEMGKTINDDEVLKEMAGAMGYDNGERFIVREDQPPQEDPGAAEAQMKMQIEDGKLQLAQMKAEQDGQIAMQRLQLDGQRMQLDMQKLQQAQALAEQRAQLDMQREELRAQLARLGIESAEEIALMQDGTTREIAALDAGTEMQRAILQGDITQAVAAQRDRTERDKAAESSAVAREGFFARQPVQSEARQPENA